MYYSGYEIVHLGIFIPLKFIYLQSYGPRFSEKAAFYAPTTKRGGHIDLPLSVCPSVRPSVRANIGGFMW